MRGKVNEMFRRWFFKQKRNEKVVKRKVVGQHCNKRKLLLGKSVGDIVSGRKIKSVSSMVEVGEQMVYSIVVCIIVMVMMLG